MKENNPNSLGGGQKIRQSLLILWCKLQGMKNIDGNVSKKLSIFS